MAPKSQAADAASPIRTLLAKLKPEIVGFAAVASLFLLAGIFSLAVYKGSAISFLGMRIEGRTDPVGDDAAIGSKGQERAGSVSLTIGELSAISNGLVDPRLTKEQLTTVVRALVGDASELRDLQKNFSFRLLRLERSIRAYGDYIDVRTDSVGRSPAFKDIQGVLREIRYFDGPVTGDQRTTYEALVAFQRDYNRKEGRQVIDTKDFGIFGYGTVEAIRRTYRHSTG
jgi:hypothetical protein